MLKRLLIPAGAVLIVAVIFVAGYCQDRDTSSEGYDIKCVQSSEPASTLPTLTCVINPKQNAKQGKSSPPWWHKLLTWPEGITAWLLLLTLGAIAWQAWATQEAARATKASVIEMHKQTVLMHVKERARLTIARVIPSDLPNPTEVIREPSLPLIEIVNQGPAYAFDVSCAFVYVLTNIEPKFEPPLHPAAISSVLKSGEVFQLKWPGPIMLPFVENETGLDPIADGYFSLYVYVKASFRDVYGPMPDVVLHLHWKVDIEKTETGVEEQPYDTANYSDWEIVDPLPKAPPNPN